MRLLTLIFIFLVSLSTIHSTSIELMSIDSVDPYTPGTHLICDPVPSAFCCHPLPGWTTALVAVFQGLPLAAVAAVYQQQAPAPGSRSPPDPSNSACDGPILDSHVGTPYWEHWAAGGAPRIAGASYYNCLPSKTARVGGLSALLGGWCFPHKMVGVIDRRESNEERGERKVLRGGYPNIISFNGTNYTDEWRGDLIYRDGEGRILDLKMLK